VLLEWWLMGRGFGWERLEIRVEGLELRAEESVKKSWTALWF